MKGMLFPLAVAFVVTGCSLEERSDFGVVENLVPPGGPTLEYSDSASYVNIEELTERLSNKERTQFTESLEWFGTESTFALEKLEGKTATQVVNTINLETAVGREKDA